MRSSGANLTKAHVALVSKVAYHLLEADRECETSLGIDRPAKHTTTSSENDISRIVTLLNDSGVAQLKEQRQSSSHGFSDPRRLGIRKVEEGWLRKYLQKEEFDVPTATHEIPRRNIKNIEDFIEL